MASSRGDEATFSALFARHRRELQAHCYRMVGSFEDSEVPWLDPYPDRLTDPHEAAVARETLEIAFVAAIQHLPARQRAALVLRDAAGFSARETAAVLGTSVPAANSALQRARTALRDRLPARRAEWAHAPDATAAEREIARRYVEALERRDFGALAALVREDARFSFPPRPVWYDGLDAFRRASDKHAAPGEHLLVPAAANLQPAVAIYLRAPGARRHRPLALAVVRVQERRVVEVIHWDRPELFGAFGLPMSFPPPHRSNEDDVTAKEGR